MEKKRRARKACVACNRRKVRCNVAVAHPCEHCAADAILCEIAPRKQRRSRRTVDKAIEESNIVASLPTSSVPEPLQEWVTEVNEPAQLGVPIPEDDGANADALAVAVEEEPPGVQHNDRMTIYFTGNSHGAVSFVANVVGTEGFDENVHYCVPHTLRKLKSREDLEYLRLKGVFSVPSEAVCDALVRTYFIHVHPVLPVLEATTFLTHFTQHGYSNVNLLLLWSVFFMAASFVEPDILRRAGFTSRKALKRAAYQRAKVLYDNAYDDDQMSLIQSVILMGHWHADAEDRFEAWHWTGVAISLCQTAGLHCSPHRATKKSLVMTEARERLCRRIWWTCVYRDRWLSMIKGRPLRIRLDDGDVAPASIEDVEYDIRQLPDSIKNKYLPYNSERISTSWCKIVETSLLLGEILAQNARRQSALPSELTQPCEADLKRCDWPIDDFDSMNLYERLSAYHVRLLYYATCIAFWRPRIAWSGDGSPEHPWRQEAIKKSRDAAGRSNGILEQMMTQDMLKYVKSQTISALVPPMQIHLMDSTSSTASIRILGSNRLQLCMNILAELRETYWAAEFAHKLFQRAQEKVVRRQRHDNQTRISNSQPSTLESRNAEPTQADFNAQSTPENLFSIDDILIPGFSFENNSGLDLLWNDNRSTENSDLNAFLVNQDFIDS